MSATIPVSQPATLSGAGLEPRDLPARLHHHAYLVADQERTRHFYEDIIGLPLRATWIENTDYEGDHLVYCHTFYGLADGGALAFFNFADPNIQKKFTAPQRSIFYHVAFKTDDANQAAILKRCTDAGYNTFEFDHGYCKSVYVTDPDGLLVEFTVDSPDVEQINAHQQRIAHDALVAWQNGERTPNNLIRPHG